MNRYQTLAANTALISIGTFGSKLLVFLMVRFYTGYLTPAEYGTADLITRRPICSFRLLRSTLRRGCSALPPTGASSGQRSSP